MCSSDLSNFSTKVAHLAVIYTSHSIARKSRALVEKQALSLSRVKRKFFFSSRSNSGSLNSSSRKAEKEEEEKCSV